MNNNPLNEHTEILTLIFSFTGPVLYDVTHSLSNFSYVELHTTPSKLELVFPAVNIPAMGYKIYQVERDMTPKKEKKVYLDGKMKYKFGTKVR